MIYYQLVLISNRDLVPDKKKTTGLYTIIVALVLGLLFAVLVRSIIHSWFFYPYIVQNDLMSPSLKKNQRVTISQGLNPDQIKRGAVVLLQHPSWADEDKFFIARIIGLPGENVEIKDRIVFINNQILQEPWEILARQKTLYTDELPLQSGNQNRDQYNSVLIPDQKIFVLQDNRSKSIDSRLLGPLDLNLIRGHIDLD